MARFGYLCCHCPARTQAGVEMIDPYQTEDFLVLIIAACLMALIFGGVVGGGIIVASWLFGGACPA